jgi:hypothetical protein
MKFWAELGKVLNLSRLHGDFFFRGVCTYPCPQPPVLFKERILVIRPVGQAENQSRTRIVFGIGAQINMHILAKAWS